jgi:hypothetical protein
LVDQRIESVNAQALAGKTVTISWWAKEEVSDENVTRVGFYYPNAIDDFSANTTIVTSPDFTLSTAWQKFTFTTTLPNEAKNGLGVQLIFPALNKDFFLAEVQLEAGTVATPFRRNAPSIQAELAACQRYYQRIGFGSAGDQFAVGFADSTTSVRFFIPLTTTMRSTPSVTFSGGTDFVVRHSGGSTTTTTSISSSGGQNSPYAIQAQPNVASGLTAGQGCILYTANTGAYIEAASEL